MLRLFADVNLGPFAASLHALLAQARRVFPPNLRFFFAIEIFTAVHAQHDVARLNWRAVTSLEIDSLDSNRNLHSNISWQTPSMTTLLLSIDA